MALEHAVSGQVVDLRPLGAALQDARSTALIKAGQLEVARIVLLAGKEMREHAAPGEITVMCLEGEVAFTTPAGTQRMAAGDWIHLQPREPHALRALVDASLLLTLCIVAPADR
jgi:quercetin dioxygenase-like cupin family protein